MTVTMSLETRQRALSEWWTEETEYLFQRIERWAACARGYNRLTSQRLSRGRMTMGENSSSRWSISGNKLFIEEASWNPRFQTLNRSHARKSQPEELKLNCCGTLNYKSNDKLDRNCLETYSYDHSIYFKTIGDLKRKRSQEMGNQSLANKDFENQDLEEKIQWEQPRKREERFNQLIFIESFSEEDVEEYSRTSAWPEVDLSKLSIDQKDGNADVDQNQNENQDQKFEFNGNLVEDENENSDFGDPLRNFEESTDSPALKNLRDSEDQKEFKRFFTQRRKSSKCRQIVGDDNIVCPGVLLTYRKNIDPESSPHRYVESVRGSDCYFVTGL